VSQLTFGVHHMAGGWAVLDPGHPVAQPEQPQGRCYFGPIADHKRDTLVGIRHHKIPVTRVFRRPICHRHVWATFAVT
jgi:hypothetical protein